MDYRLDLARIESGLRTRFMGRCIDYHESITSTNTRATELAKQGAPAGALVIADHQTAGRGRLGRRWIAPPGSALLMSLILRPALAPAQAQRATMLCSLAAVDAIARVTGLHALVKWPNDILLHGRKLGGILTELGVRDQRLDYIVVGMGLNVNLDLADLPEVLTPAASLSHELGYPVAREELLLALLHEAERLHDQLAASDALHTLWRQRLATLGQDVTVTAPDGVLQGRAEDVDQDGALLVRAADGQLQRVLAGDVTLRAHASR